MSATSWGWLVLAFPLAGMLVIALGWKVLPDRVAGWIGSAAIGAAFASAIAMLIDAPGPARGRAHPGRLGLDLRRDRRLRGRPVDPRRPAVGLHVPGRDRRVVPDPRLLGRLHGVGPLLQAVLRLPQLLRLLDAAAGPGRELRPADRRLGVRRRGVLPADLLLVPPRDGDQGRHQGVRDQRRRRRRAGDRRLPALRRDRGARLRRRLRPGHHRVRPQRRPARRRLPAAARRRVREVGPAAAAHLAPGRDGGPDAGLLADPRRDDGHRGRLPDRAHAPAVRAGPGGRRHQRRDRHARPCSSPRRSRW